MEIWKNGWNDDLCEVLIANMDDMVKLCKDKNFFFSACKLKKKTVLCGFRAKKKNHEEI